MRPSFPALLIGLLSGCGLLGPGELSPCAPVDVGGECFTPSHDAFIEHAILSSGAWPQLDGLEITADRVITGEHLDLNDPTWVVPLLADGEMVAISRFFQIDGDQVKLAEVALLERPLEPLPADLDGEMVLFVNIGCVDDAGLECLFSEHGWALRLDDGRFRTPDGAVVDSLP